jgi:hypothetical protein
MVTNPSRHRARGRAWVPRPGAPPDRHASFHGDEMIDEASHKMGRAIVARGRASGLGHDNPGDDAGIGSGNT